MTPENGWRLFLVLCALDDVLETVVAALLCTCAVLLIGYIIISLRSRKMYRRGKITEVKRPGE